MQGIFRGVFNAQVIGGHIAETDFTITLLILMGLAHSAHDDTAPI